MSTTSHSSPPESPVPVRDGPSPGWPVVYAGARPTVLISGRADRAAVNQLSGAIRGLCAVGLRHLVVDVSDARDCDGRLLTVLARTHTQLADTTGTLDIIGVKLPQFLAALRHATLDEVFVIYDAVRQETRNAHAGPNRPIPKDSS
jgi:hypothetical protein